MSKKRKVIVHKERTVNTYAEFWHTSKCLLKKGAEQKEGSFHQFMASLVFTAFAFEAFLNHIGPKVFSCWDDLERLAPKEKLSVLSEKLQVDVSYGRRPWQVMRRLFGFRNDIAHGKSVKVTYRKTVPVDDRLGPEVDALAQTKWEKYCTRENAERAREDVEKIMRTLHDACGLEDDVLFGLSFQSGGASLLSE